MKWSWKIATVAGIPIRVHATFLLLLLFIAWSHAGEGMPGMAQGVFFVLLLFACVVAHELGHSIVGQRLGYKVRDITLLPIGGLASFERLPTKPSQELAIAIAGPLVNVVLAVLLYAALAATGGLQPVEQLGVAQGSLLERLLLANVVLAAFNLLPAFPMDGGRMLRAILAQRMGFDAATQAAARVGQAMALGFGLIGLMYNPFLLFIALFVYMGAEQEAAAVHLRSMFEGLTVQSAMVTRFATLRTTEPVTRALELLLETEQHDFPVLTDDAGHVAGVLTRTMLLGALARGEEKRPVGELLPKGMSAGEWVLRTESGLEEGVERLRALGLSSVPVVRDGTVVGMLTLENVAELAMIHNARTRAARNALPSR